MAVKLFQGCFSIMGGFNTQPPEGGWTVGNHDHIALAVSTHSRPKVAGFTRIGTRLMREVSTHSRLKAADSISWLICCNN
ncbi:hypothetical protein ACTHUR_17560 [Neisseria sp. P0021.S007]|uniref:hypothetical protein n=1 Tax=Neisseria sp. P0021.S006 TaxID=3436821 RepID=UPI003F7DB4A9